MTTNTILKLNDLNARFYQKVAQDFSDSRSYYWQGWENLKPVFEKLKKRKTLKVLDIGCGNGRFGKFLVEKVGLKNLEYHGLDNSPSLLQFAEESLSQLNINHHLTNMDVVVSLLNDSFLKKLIDTKFDLVTMFGVIHHIPSFELRKKILKDSGQLLKDNSQIIFTTWRFVKEPRFEKKVISPTELGIDLNQLEKNDYILDWQRGQTAYRYCHYTNQTEVNKLLTESGLKTVNEFQADGKSHQLNLYTCAVLDNNSR